MTRPDSSGASAGEAAQSPAHGQAQFQLHPVQLVRIFVTKVRTECVSDAERVFEPVSNFRLKTSRSIFGADDSAIMVAVRAELGDLDSFGYVVEAEVAGVFAIDRATFKSENVDHFAANNAPLILYPYLRGVVASALSTAMLPACIVPLLTVPAFKVVKTLGADQAEPDTGYAYSSP